MNYKLICHFMPHEIDYALLTAIQLKKSKYYIDFNEHNVTVEFVLNLSSYLIDWDKSKLPKEFFKEKFKSLETLLKDYTFISKIYEGGELYGHLDAQRECIEKSVDYYITLCPDMYFSETLLSYLISASCGVKNKYFVITPEISKLWDYTWDEITHDQLKECDYKDWDKVDTFDIRNTLKNITENVSLQPATNSKFAGWFDLCNKAFWEELVPIQETWHGYGPYDFYSMMITEKVKSLGWDFEQYILRNQIIFEYSVGPLKDTGFSGYYKNYLEYNKIPNQRKEFESKLPQYIHEWLNKNKV